MRIGGLYRHRWEVVGFILLIATLFFAAAFDTATKGGWLELWVMLFLAVFMPVGIELLIPPTLVWRIGSQAFGMVFTIYPTLYVVLGEALPVATGFVVYVIATYILSALIAYGYTQDA